METEPFDEADLLPASPSSAASPPPRLKRLKKFSQIVTPPAASPVAPSPPPPPQSDPETLIPSPPSPREPSPPALADTEEEDDGLDPLFAEPRGSDGWDSRDMPMGEEEEEIMGGGLIEELRREKSAKKRLDMVEDGDAAAAATEVEVEVEVKGKRSKRRKKEDAPSESAREKKVSEKERRVQLDSIHSESQRLLRETWSASFKPTLKPVYKPISSVLEKIRLRKLEILKKSNTPPEDDDASMEPPSDSAGHPDVPVVEEASGDDKDLKNDYVEGSEVGVNDHDLNQHSSVPKDEDALNFDEDLTNSDSKTLNKDILNNCIDDHKDNAQSNDSSDDAVDDIQLASSSSPTKCTNDISSEDEEDDDDKENIDPSTKYNNETIHQHLQRSLGKDLSQDDALLKDFVDDEAEEEDDSDNDLMRFKDNEEDDESDENEVFNDLIAAGYEEGEVDHKKRNELHQKWLQQRDAAETDNVLQRLKFGQQEQKELIDQAEDDSEDCEDESENEMFCDLTPSNVVRQNSEKAKQMILNMFTDDNDTYEHSDDEEIEELLARQRLSKREVLNNSFRSPLEDENSREVFGLIKKLNIAPQPKRRGKQATSNLEMLMVGGNSNSSSKSSFLGRTSSGAVASSHKSSYRTYVFGRDDSNSRSCLSTSESNSDMDQTNTSQPRKMAKFSSSQTKPVASRTDSEGCSGASLFEILRRSSVTFDKQEYNHQKSCDTMTESQATYQFSAFKLSRRFSRVGGKN